MATAREIINDSLIEIGVLGQGASAGDNVARLGLVRLQKQMDAWKADDLTLSVLASEEYDLPSGDSFFTIGDGADLDAQRPAWIEGMNYVNPGSSPENEVVMGQMDWDSYLAQSQKTLESALPQQFFYQPSFPPTHPEWGRFFIWPTPTQDITLKIYYGMGTDEPAALDSELVGPAGYQEAFMYQLALRLCTPFGRPVPDLLPQMAVDAYQRIKRPNTHPPILGVDPALVPTFGGAFNIQTGTWTGNNSQ